MATFVYRRELSESARDLAEALDATRWRDRLKPLTSKVRNGDAVVCWGEAFVPPTGVNVKVLNGGPLQNKFADALKLTEKGVPTIQVSKTKPQDVIQIIPAGADPAVAQWEAITELAEDFANIEVGSTIRRDQVTVAAVSTFAQALAQLQRALATPVPTEQRIATASGNWLGRDRNHVGGADLITPTTTPDYFSKREDGIVREYRVHSFLGKSIRAGIKDARIDDAWVRSGKTPHDWIRSWDGGYRIKYDGVSSKQRHRDLAHAAIEALGLQFGAVDIGERADNSLIVFEVNRAPGIEGGSLEAYKTAIQAWFATA